ncbi:hemolysin III family protein [Corynebacterium mendelii]|uniref:Hemolysin III family protein n=1 Tax=Corynebacterium mendelii TaxID=2765362 RepID=A0A939IY08_9CORY|nr:hemolysin III family protein [Corynebacterium mendelii]MBN9645035.1 hemolysin III family protein [Corynebacterium mendelii]
MGRTTGVDAAPTDIVAVTRCVADRGRRPVMRGFMHLAAAVAALVQAGVMVTYAAVTGTAAAVLGAVVYSAGLIGLFGVSAFYHLYPFSRPGSVRVWQRLDHSMIAVFTACTYTPVCLLALPPGHAAWLLPVAWGAAVAAVVMNVVWIGHPPLVDVIVYAGLGWLIVPLAGVLWHTSGAAVVWLLVAGGIVYTVGSLAYGFHWPGRKSRVFGYHEWFHAATVVAAVIHLVAVWMIVVEAG